MAKERTYYQHKRTGTRIIIDDIFLYVDCNKDYDYNMCHVLQNGNWRYIPESKIDSDYVECEEQIYIKNSERDKK